MAVAMVVDNVGDAANNIKLLSQPTIIINGRCLLGNYDNLINSFATFAIGSFGIHHKYYSTTDNERRLYAIQHFIYNKLMNSLQYE